MRDLAEVPVEAHHDADVIYASQSQLHDVQGESEIDALLPGTLPGNHHDRLWRAARQRTRQTLTVPPLPVIFQRTCDDHDTHAPHGIEAPVEMASGVELTLDSPVRSTSVETGPHQGFVTG
jgi:hypothetical protein